MIVDFQVHYTPPAFQKNTSPGALLDERGNPCYFLNPLLSDLDAHLRTMDEAGIDAMVLSCGPGFDQPDAGLCQQINDACRQAELSYPGRFIGLAHVPALNGKDAKAELKRCAVDLGFPGVVIGSELQGQALDSEALLPFWTACQELGLYVFIHPLPAVINSGLLDRLPDLKIQFSHFSGGIGRYLGRLRGFQQRAKWGTAGVERHNRQPVRPLDYYLEERLYYDIAGWAGPDHAAEWGAEWVRFGLQEVAASQVVFATDYPQAVRDPAEVAAYVQAVQALSPTARQILHGANVAKLIPDIASRLARRKQAA